MTTTKTLQLLVSMLGAFGLASGCVRLNEPDEFICNTDADCESTERCPYRGAFCVRKAYCGSEAPCPSGRHCDYERSRCVVDKCTPETAAAVCAGYACNSGECETLCVERYHCASGPYFCSDSQCFELKELPNGSSCARYSDCSSDVCCEYPSGAVCADSCLQPNGSSCAGPAHCSSNTCCEYPSGSVCADSCLQLNGSSCDVGSQCRSGMCCPSGAIRVCADSCLVTNGSLCVEGAECSSGVCCPSGAVRVCAASCP